MYSNIGLSFHETVPLSPDIVSPFMYVKYYFQSDKDTPVDYFILHNYNKMSIKRESSEI